MSGTVSFEGKPLTSGTVVFIPNDPDLAVRPTEFSIADGIFAVNPPFGVAPGKYVISVVDFDERYPDGYTFDHVFKPGQKTHALEIEIESSPASTRR